MTDKSWTLDTTVQDCLEASEYSWRDLQKLLIEATLRRFKGNKTHAAKALGISLRTLRTKCKVFKL